MKIGIEVMVQELKGGGQPLAHPRLIDQFEVEGASLFRKYIETQARHGLTISFNRTSRLIYLGTCCSHTAGFRDGSRKDGIIVFSMDEFDDPFIWDKPDVEDILTLILKKLENVK